MKGVVRSGNSPKSIASGNGNGVNGKPERDRKEDRVTKMVFVMIVAFLIVWSPYAIAVVFTIAKVGPRFIKEVWALKNKESQVAPKLP